MPAHPSREARLTEVYRAATGRASGNKNGVPNYVWIRDAI